MKRTTKPLRIGHDPDPRWATDQMKELVTTLNPTVVKTRRQGEPTSTPIQLPLSEMQIELRRLVKAWMRSGPNLRKMFAKEPELERRTKHGKTLFYSAPRGGRGYLDWSPITPESNLLTDEFDYQSDKDKALYSFMILIANPLWASLSRPCRRCKKYFLKTSERRRVYCNRRCSSSSTAISSVKKFREAKKREKLSRAKASIAQYKKKKRSWDWKTWVCADANVTPQWLTRAVNDRFLRAPRATERQR